VDGVACEVFGVGDGPGCAIQGTIVVNDGSPDSGASAGDRDEVLAYILSMVTELSQMAATIDEPDLARRLLDALLASPLA